jgi:hypothetical protein
MTAEAKGCQGIATFDETLAARLWRKAVLLAGSALVMLTLIT